MKELMFDTTITWDPCRLKEIDEAKAHILSYKRGGYEIITADGKPMERFHPSLGEVKILVKKVAHKTWTGLMKILCEEGDKRLTWDKENGKEAKEAKKEFLDLIANGYKAYSVNENGKKSRRIEEFDVDAEEILMIPPTSKG